MTCTFVPVLTPNRFLTRDHGVHIENQRYRSFGKQADSSKISVRACRSVDLTSRSKPSVTNNLRRLLTRDANPVTLGRRGLSQNFAVTLMRTGYSVTDDLDIVAMQEFQKQFFETRQLEWEVYIEKNKGVRQGSLTDAAYFDFISFAQMLTIHDVISKPLAIFEEQFQEHSGVFQTRVVKRDIASLPDANAIYAAWQRMMGERLLNAFSSSLEDAMPTQRVQNDTEILKIRRALRAIYSFFTENGYCLDAQWSYDGRPKTVDEIEYLGRVELVAPCILWGNHSLRKRKCIPNDYDCFVVSAAMQSHFGLYVDFDTSFTTTSLLRTWRVCNENDGRKPRWPTLINK